MAGNDKRDPYADEVASAKALMSEKQYDEQPWGDWAGDAVGNALNTAKAILPTALGGRGEVGISDIARGAYEGAKDAVTFPGDVISGKQPLYDESGRPLESAVGRSLNTVGAVGGASSLVPVPDNSLRVFGGIKSKTADKNALTQAQIMESQGASPEDIHGSTGWYRGTDEQWRYEIPDVGSTVDPGMLQLDLYSPTIASSQRGRLGDYLNHPEFFSAYPEMKNMEVRLGPADHFGSDYYGYYMPRYDNAGFFTEPYIKLTSDHLKTPEQQRNTLLHEIQHAVQQKEGFMRGANPNSFAPDTIPDPRVKIYEDAVANDPDFQEWRALEKADEFQKQIREANKFYKQEYDPRFKALNMRDDAGEDTYGEWAKLSDEYEKKVHEMFPLMKRRAELGQSLTRRGIPLSKPMRQFLTPQEAYERTAGEVEARNVQKRKDMPVEELKYKFPDTTEDIQKREQLIDWNDTSWRKGYAGRGRVAKGIADEVVDLAKRILGSEPEVRKVTGAELLKKTEGLSEDPFGYSKFAKPLSEMEYTVKMLPREEYKSLDPYDLVNKNATIVGHISDRTAAGREVSNIGGVDLTEPLKQRGGVDFQRTTPYSWANRPGAGKTLNKKLNEAAKGGDPVYTTPVFMGASSANSSHMVGAPLIRMIPNLPISQADKLAFDAMMSERFPGWPGINNTEAAEKFMYSGNVPGSAISRFIDYASAKKWKGAGFPDTSEIMFSAMDPRLVGVPQGSTGMGFKEFDPGKEVIVKGPESHPDYPASIPGKEYAGGFKYQVPQSLMMSDWWKSLKPELRLPENATKAQHTLMTQIPSQKATPEWADRILEHWEKNPKPWGYADGGEVEDDIYHAVRLARDVGGATNENPQVMMTDANGVQYDATGKVIPAATPQADSNSAAAPSPTTPEEVGRRAAEDPATFDAMMERYAVPDRDIVDYEALKKEVSQQPQQVQQMTHVGAPPMRDIKVDMPLFGGEYSAGQAPYDIANPMSGVAQTAYDWKTTPLYFTPWTAPIGAGMDVAEGVATGDPLTASLAIGFGPGGKMAKAAGIGAANYFIDPSEAEAGPARWFSKAMEVASALPMEKMTGQQALAMLRKGTSPEELRWTGAENFLSSRPQVSKSELVDYLNNNRVKLNQVTLGGSGRPTRLQDISHSQIPEEILSKYRKGVNDAIELKVKYLAEADSLLAPDKTIPYDNYAQYKSLMGKATQAGEVVDQLGAQMRQEYADSIGGLGVASKFGPDSSHGENLTTPGGKNYQENLYQIPQRDIYTPFVEKMRKDMWDENYREAIANGFSEDRAQRFADSFRNTSPEGMARFLGREEELASVFNSQRSLKEGSYTGGHWGEYPDVIAHTRTNELLYEPPGSNRPYRVHNVEETQSDPGQAGRKRGFKDPQAMAAVARLRQETQDLKAKLKSEQARLYSEHQERIAPYVEERVRYERELRDKYKRGEISLGDMNRAAEEYAGRGIEPELTGKYRAESYETLNPMMDKIAANEAEIERIGSKIGSIPMMPYVTSTEAWTDLAIKKELDKALDSGSDYFSWTPGEAHVERYDLSRHIGKIQYNPDDGSFLAYDPKGKMVVNESINDPSEMEEYVGKELAEKILAEEKNRRYSIEDAYSVDKDEDTGRWMVSVNGEPAYDDIGSPLDFDSKGEAKDYVNQMMADDFSNYPVTLEGLDIKTGGEGMTGYYDKIYLKRVQEVLKKATGAKPEIEVIEVQTSAGPRKQLGIRLTDEMREKARFSDFNRGGTVTAPSSYGNDDPAVSRAIALTREY